MDETSVTSRPGTGPGDDAAGEADGRAVRGERTRLAVVDALLALNDDGHLRPTAKDIAERAGVSTRTLYVHFADLDALIVAASDRQRQRLDEVLPPVVGAGTFAERLAAFVERRATLHEFGRGVRRAAVLQEPSSPAMQEVLRSARRALRAEVRHCFAPELDAAGTGRDQLLAALDATATSATWEALRVHQGLDPEAARSLLHRMLTALVAEWAPGAGEAGPDPGGRA